VGEYDFPFDVKSAFEVGPGLVVVTVCDLKGRDHRLGWTLESVEKVVELG
jgi:hypothetical protein